MIAHHRGQLDWDRSIGQTVQQPSMRGARHAGPHQGALKCAQPRMGSGRALYRPLSVGPYSGSPAVCATWTRSRAASVAPRALASSRRRQPTTPAGSSKASDSRWSMVRLAATRDRDANIRRDYAQGLAKTEIAARYGVTEGAIRKVLRRPQQTVMGS